MNRFYEYLADQMIAHSVANPEDKDVIVYGLDMIIYTLVSLGALIYILAIPAVFILWRYAPIEHVNATMSSEKKVRMRKYTHAYLAILSIIFCMTTFLNPMIAKIIALAILDCGISYVMALFSEDTLHQS